MSFSSGVMIFDWTMWLKADLSLSRDSIIQRRDLISWNSNDKQDQMNRTMYNTTKKNP